MNCEDLSLRIMEYFWFMYVSQTFEGNVNSEAVVRHELQHAILARYIRFIPLEWSREGRTGVRLELYGCSYCEYK